MELMEDAIGRENWGICVVTLLKTTKITLMSSRILRKVLVKLMKIYRLQI